MEISEIVRTVPDGCEIDVLVSPRSNRSGPEGVDEWRKMLIVRVKAPPLDGRANKEVESCISDITKVRGTIVRGHTSRQKTVFIPLSVADAVKLLENP